MGVSFREVAVGERAGASHRGGHPAHPAHSGKRGRRPHDHWSRGKLAIAAVVLAVVAAVLGAVGMLWRQPGLPAVDTVPVLVVWRVPGQAAPNLSMIERGRWRSFVASRMEEQERTRRMIVDDARAEMTAALAPVFEEMKGRVKDYNNWFYSFPTTYRMAFTGGLAAFGREEGDPRSVEQVATEALNKLLQDRFLDVVVVPEHFGPTVEGIARTVLQHAIAREQEVGAAETKVLAAFMVEQSHPVEGGRSSAGDSPPVVLSWEALGIPGSAAAMAAPPDALRSIKSDPALTLLQTTTTTEGMMLVARQLARRVVHSAVSDVTQTMVLPLMASTHLGPLEAVASPLLGITAFGIGLVAEASTVSVRQMVEGQRLTDLSLGIVDSLRENQSRSLSDAVTRRIDTWLRG